MAVMHDREIPLEDRPAPAPPPVALGFLVQRVLQGLPGYPALVLGTLAIGEPSGLGFDVLMGGPLTGAAINPARAFGPALASGYWRCSISCAPDVPSCEGRSPWNS